MKIPDHLPTEYQGQQYQFHFCTRINEGQVKPTTFLTVQQPTNGGCEAIYYSDRFPWQATQHPQYKSFCTRMANCLSVRDVSDFLAGVVEWAKVATIAPASLTGQSHAIWELQPSVYLVIDRQTDYALLDSKVGVLQSLVFQGGHAFAIYDDNRLTRQETADYLKILALLADLVLTNDRVVPYERWALLNGRTIA